MMRQGSERTKWLWKHKLKWKRGTAAGERGGPGLCHNRWGIGQYREKQRRRTTEKDVLKSGFGSEYGSGVVNDGADGARVA